MISCAGLRLQSFRQLLMQPAATSPLLPLGLNKPLEKRAGPSNGRVINLTAHAMGFCVFFAKSRKEYHANSQGKRG